jgi:hypothetical protein
MHPDLFFEQLWHDYIRMAPQAERIQTLFRDRGESIVNDHVAFRTLNLPPIPLSALEPHLLNLGYQRYEAYEFPEKKLQAWGYVHTSEFMPRVFLSELKCELLSTTAQTILEKLCQQVDPQAVQSPTVFWSGLLWQPIAWQDYQTLLSESEYAAWVAALGLRPNHFTLSVNHLQQTPTLEDVLAIVEHQTIPLNTSGGRIKGSPKVLLEQGSTLADRLPIPFANEEIHEIPTCYYEFARRYPMPDGTLYPGFVAASADRIFESTNQR